MTLHEAADEIADEWEELAGRANAAPFMYPGWILAWQRAFARRPLAALVIRDGGRLAAVLPIARRRHSLRSPTNWHTPVFAPVAESDAALAELAGELYGSAAPLVDVAFLTSGSRELQTLETAALSAGRRTVKRVLLRSPSISLEGSAEEFEAGLGGRRRRDIARKRRRLEDHLGASASLEVLSDAEALGEPLEAAFRLEGSGWKTERGTAILSRPDTRRFYSEIAAWAAERGWFRLLFLRVGEQRVAVDMCLDAGAVLYLLKGGFDTRYARFSPGVVLKRETLMWCFETGHSAYELLGNEARDKAIWTQQAHERELLQCFSSSGVGRAQHLAYAYGRPLAKRLKDRLPARDGSTGEA